MTANVSAFEFPAPLVMVVSQGRGRIERARQQLPGVPITLRTAVGTTTNSRLPVATAGCHSFALDATSTTSPVLTVTARTTGAGDPDVFAFARTLAGQPSVVVVVNNERSAVDLDELPGGGVDLQGLVADGAVTEITGAAVGNLQVANGRLRGRVPALTAVALVD